MLNKFTVKEITYNNSLQTHDIDSITEFYIQKNEHSKSSNLMSPDVGKQMDETNELDKVTIKILPFWSNKLEIRFCLVEVRFALSDITNKTTKFNYLMPSWISMLQKMFVISFLLLALT